MHFAGRSRQTANGEADSRKIGKPWVVATVNESLPGGQPFQARLPPPLLP